MKHPTRCPKRGTQWDYWHEGEGPFSAIQSIVVGGTTAFFRCPGCLKEWDRDDPEIWENDG